MKKILIFLFVLFSLSCLAFSSYAYSSTDGHAYYLDDCGDGVIVVLELENTDNGPIYKFIEYLFRPEFFELLDSEYRKYEKDDVQSQYDTFADYMEANVESSQVDWGGDEKIRETVNGWEALKKQQKEEDDNNNDNTGGQNPEGGDGNGGGENSDFTGPEDLEIETIPPGIPKDGKCLHTAYGSDEPCECYYTGYYDGWRDSLTDSRLWDMLQQAYEKGFGAVNTSGFRDRINQERNDAVKSYKQSNEHNEELQAAKETAIQEYLESSDYEELIEDAKEKAINDFKQSDEYKQLVESEKEAAVNEYIKSPEFLAIIGEAEEGAVADFVAEMESILAGEGTPGEGTPSESLSNSINSSLESSFNEGVTAGADVHKQSSEYKEALKSEYTAGSQAGYQQGVIAGTNDGYEKGLLDGAEMANEALYNLGKTEYMNTEEYRNNIQSIYDQGYSDGVSETDNSINYIVPIILLSALVLVYVGLTFSIKKKSSKHKR